LFATFSHKGTGELFAIKTINKNSVQELMTSLTREIQILKTLDHPNIIKVKAVLRLLVVVVVADVVGGGVQ